MMIQRQQISWLVVGVVLGLSVGIFPGLGGIAGLSLVLPFLYGMDPVSDNALAACPFLDKGKPSNIVA